MNDIGAELTGVLRDQPDADYDAALLDRVHARIGRRRFFRRSAVAATVVLVAAGAVVAGINQRSGHVPPPPQHHPNPVVARLAVGPVASMAVLGGDMWVFNHHGFLIRIEMRSDKVTLRTRIAGLQPENALLVAGQGKLWLAGTPKGTRPGQGVFVLSPVTGEPTARLDLGGTCYSESPATNAPIMTFGAGHLWVVCWSAYGNQRRVLRIDPLTDRIDASTGVIPGSGSESIIASAVGVWYTTDTTAISRIEASGRGLDHVLVSNAGLPSSLDGSELAAGQDALWAIASDASIARIDPSSGRITKFYPAFDPAIRYFDQPFAVSHGSIWLLADATLVRLSSRSGHVQAKVVLGAPGTAMIITRDAIWAGTFDGVLRVDPALMAG
jgi:hypothetical protein